MTIYITYYFNPTLSKGVLHFIIDDIYFLETCDEVLETAWSTMWNVTDETPINCERFLDGGGMQLFLQCKEVSTSN